MEKLMFGYVAFCFLAVGVGMIAVGIAFIAVIRLIGKALKQEKGDLGGSSLQITPAWEHQETQRRFQEQMRQAHDAADRAHQEACNAAIQMQQEAHNTAVQMHEQAHIASTNPFFM